MLNVLAYFSSVDFYGEFVLTFVPRKTNQPHNEENPVYLLDRNICEKVYSSIVI